MLSPAEQRRLAELESQLSVSARLVGLARRVEHAGVHRHRSAKPIPWWLIVAGLLVIPAAASGLVVTEGGGTVLVAVIVAGAFAMIMLAGLAGILAGREKPRSGNDQGCRAYLSGVQLLGVIRRELWRSRPARAGRVTAW